jgi:predicted DNA binding CopG/RHH family protein
MRDEYDFSQSHPNFYLKRLQKRVTICLEDEVVVYFKELSEQYGIPYRNLIHLYLLDCVKAEREPSLE